MARARTTEHARSRSKAAQIEEIARSIEQFQDILVSIEDFSREGFPYRDAARAKAELQLRECVRRIFGDKSPEFQTYRNHKLRTTNKGETAQSVAVVKSLIRTLEDKKLGLQGIKPPVAESPAEATPAAAPRMTLVPPTAQITMPSQPASSTPPMTLSVAMTTSLGMQAAPPTAPPQSPSPATAQTPSITSSKQSSPATPSSIQAPTAPPIPAPPAPSVPATPSPAPTLAGPPSSHPVSLPAQNSPPMVEQAASPSPPAVSTSPLEQPSINPSVHSYSTDTKEILRESAASSPRASKPSLEEPSIPLALSEVRSDRPMEEPDPLERIRKVCLRFHAVTRQLRLRKDYRATLEVEDDYDLQDLLCALLKVEFDEVGTDEWTPPYAGGAPRTTFLIQRDQIAVVAKKTRSGLTTNELADQVTADSARYAIRDKCNTLFCFIYDPEGRIGSPKRLETDLTSVSDRYTIEVLVAPK